jgi:hypothetical protein
VGVVVVGVGGLLVAGVVVVGPLDGGVVVVGGVVETGASEIFTGVE